MLVIVGHGKQNHQKRSISENVPNSYGPHRACQVPGPLRSRRSPASQSYKCLWLTGKSMKPKHPYIIIMELSYYADRVTEIPVLYRNYAGHLEFTLCTCFFQENISDVFGIRECRDNMLKCCSKKNKRSCDWSVMHFVAKWSNNFKDTEWKSSSCFHFYDACHNHDQKNSNQTYNAKAGFFNDARHTQSDTINYRNH